MIITTQGLVLRSVKYGETSLICTLFTRAHGVQAYLVQGIRITATKSRQSRAGLLQPAMLLDIVAYHKSQKSLKRLKEFSPAYIYQHLQEDVVRNSIALFSLELLLRLLPEEAPMPGLFDFSFSYFRHLDRMPAEAIANFPLFFLVQCSRFLGYDIQGGYKPETPYLNLREGSFTSEPPGLGPTIGDEDASVISRLQQVQDIAALSEIKMNAGMRQRLMEWYLQFLHSHTDHMGAIKSLAVLKTILHG